MLSDSNDEGKTSRGAHHLFAVLFVERLRGPRHCPGHETRGSGLEVRPADALNARDTGSENEEPLSTRGSDVDKQGIAKHRPGQKTLARPHGRDFRP